MPADLKPLKFLYQFTLPEGKVKRFELSLDSQNLSLISPPRTSYPDWTRLSFSQCPNCPLQSSSHPRCPAAVNMTDLVEAFKDVNSWEQADIEIQTEARSYSKQTSAAEGISSLIGIYMVTSGCPILDRLKPMVRSHVPFATWDETVYRAVSMYLLAQYFLSREGRKPDWDLERLREIYEEIGIVDKAFCERFRDTSFKDSIVNALIELDCFAQMTTQALKEKELAKVRGLFGAYLNEVKSS